MREGRHDEGDNNRRYLVVGNVLQYQAEKKGQMKRKISWGGETMLE